MANAITTAPAASSVAAQQAHLIHHSKTFLIDALAAAGVDCVSVHYSGDNGEGFISLVRALGTKSLQGESMAPLVDLRAVPHFANDRRAGTLHTLVVIFVWNLIGHFHPGALDDHGAAGVVTIHVPEAAVTVKHSARRMVSIDTLLEV